MANPEPLLSPDELQHIIEQENRLTLDLLVAQLRSPVGVIPFVGAGMSAGFGFPQWGDFLTEAGRRTPDRERIERLVANKDFETAAEEVEKLDADLLQEIIDNAFGQPLDETRLLRSALALLPLLTCGPVITTNFDHAIEQAYALQGVMLDPIVLGPRADSIVRVIYQNKRGLLKIHGDCDDRRDRVFTKWMYQANWEGGDGRVATLSGVAQLLFTSRPLLFLGCSLETDRTVEAMREIQANLGGYKHFAILAPPLTRAALVERRTFLKACGIRPLWFPPGQFEQIRTLLEQAIDRSSCRAIRGPQDPPLGPHLPPVSLGHLASGSASPTALVRALAEHIHRNHLIFFVGAGAHLGQVPQADAFYKLVGTKFGAEELPFERSDLARHLIDLHGREAVWAAGREMVKTDEITPSIVYRLIQWLATLQPIVFTTNYDTMLERTWESIGLNAYHLFYYQSGGPDEGRFIHRKPDRSLRVIERPDNVRALDPPGAVIVKLNGGITVEDAISESALFARGDYEALSTRIPQALPACIRDALRERGLLFLGHAIREPDVEAVARFVSGSGRLLRSWAVAREVDPNRQRYLELCGVQTIHADLNEFVPSLAQAILDLSK